MAPITEKRWKVAQEYEAAYWAKEARNPEKLARDIADGHHFTAGVLDIRWETVRGTTVLDIAGGPHPLGVDHLGAIDRYVVLDPASYPDDGMFERIHARAEGWRGEMFDQVFGYNVLQHVVDPAEVMATARACALTRIRWFDVVDTPIYPVHPHSISADWLRKELTKDGFRLTRDIDGSRLIEGHRQKWIALVASRST